MRNSALVPARRVPSCLTLMLLVGLAAGCSSSSQPPADPVTDASGSREDGGSNDDGSMATEADSGADSAAATCDPSLATTSCETCTLTSCCAESRACLLDPDCEQYARCLHLDRSGAGTETCGTDAGSTTAEFTAYDSCMRSSCAASCATCQGTALPCTSYANQTVCVAVGCAWLNSGNRCTGSLPPVCGLFTDSTKCTEAGCQWTY